MSRNRSCRWSLLALGAAALTLVGAGWAQEGEGTRRISRQALVGGTVIDDSLQERFALLGLAVGNGGCSASLLRNGWAITAAHCVEATDSQGNFMPDPARPGQNQLSALNTIRLTANWKTEQTRRAVRVETFRPYDIAIIQTDTPFSVRGSMTGYSRLVFQDGQFPHFGNPVGADLLVFGQGINVFASGEGDAAVPSQSDGQYRNSWARPNSEEATLYWYPSEGGQMIAGGDSGGPSFARVLSGWALVGVHALATTVRVPGKPKTGWTWVTATPKAADAPIAPVLGQILKILGPVPPGQPEFTLDSPPPGFIGTFSKTPPNFQPLWLYGIRPNGDLMWFRKDTNATAWQGPKKVGTGWSGFKDIIAAGGNRFYGLTQTGKLMWFQHDGFNDGTFNWKPGAEIGSGWTFSRIFSGGEGIIYAVRQDGKLIWYRHTGFETGARVWSNAKEVGSEWGGYKDVFSTGKGAVYALKDDGTLLFFQQRDYANGAKSWEPARQVGTGWGDFKQIVPCGDGVILAITHSGTLRWYRHLGRLRSNGRRENPAAFARIQEVWEGPVEIGSGWQDFGKVVGLIPLASAPVVR